MELDLGETRVTDPATGGAKGSKLARFDLIPPDILYEDAEHYGKGEAKYPSDAEGRPNWTRGYAWHLSIAALQRHLFAWINGEATDPETGTHHLIAVRWHAAALRTFEKRGLGTDDRLVTTLAKRLVNEAKMLADDTTRRRFYYPQLPPSDDALPRKHYTRGFKR